MKPIERVWKLIRKLFTDNRYFPRLEDIFTIACKKF
ncbi:MAG: hypothetical protein JXA38_07155 [Methanosarcinaceae archaeon]|nr:hypothetical protein [Methanosarcinaceae archaeon]